MYICFTKHIEMGKHYLGEFEELILTMVMILKDDAYGNTIVQAIKEYQDRVVNLSAVHVTLYRLEEKGYLKSDMRGATKERGGRRKRYFQVTSLGETVIQEIKSSRTKLWNLIPQLNFSS